MTDILIFLASFVSGLIIGATYQKRCAGKIPPTVKAGPIGEDPK